jgi:cell division protein FtsA
LLPAGVILTGGASQIKGIVELAKNVLKLPVHVGRARELEGEGPEVFDPAFSTVAGALLVGYDQELSYSPERKKGMLDSWKIGRTIKGWLDDILP